MRRSLVTRGFLGAALTLMALIGLATALAVFQGRRTPMGTPRYVALGSSFAAGAGLGPLQAGSPWLCARSVNGYPQQLARMRALSVVDMSCGGAVTKHVLRGGQFFQGPQIRVIDARTQLVTLTVGGNDIGYIGDMSLIAMRDRPDLFGWLMRTVWTGPKTPSKGGYDKLQEELVATLDAIHKRAPEAMVVLATYPTILPPLGTCPRLGLSAAEADVMRQVGDQLAATTRAAAERGGAILVDMHKLGAMHNACSSSPWTRGWTNAGVAPFHPTLLGAQATAEAISRVVKLQR